MRHSNIRSPQIVYLVIASYGGKHLYGSLRWYDIGDKIGRNIGRLDVECVLGPYAARRMNREDPTYRYMVGDDCSRFIDEASLRSAALYQFRTRFNEDSQILIEAEPGDPELSRVLHGPEPWRTEINAIHEEFCKEGYSEEVATRYETKMLEIIPEKLEQ